MERKNGFKLSFIMFCLSIVVSVLTIMEVRKDKPLWLDEKITALFSNVPEAFHPFFIQLTAMGDKKGIGLVALLVLAYLLIRKKDFTGMGAFALAIALGNELSKWIKDTVARPRPELEHLVPVSSYSFPSGHAMLGMILYFFTVYFITMDLKSKKAKKITAAVFIIFILLLGASRIILQVHFPTDVIGGYALGYAWVYLWILLYNYSKKIAFKK